MPKKLGIGGFNAYMSKPTRPAGPMIGIFPQRAPTRLARPAGSDAQQRAVGARRQIAGRASDARAQIQGRVVSATRQTADRASQARGQNQGRVVSAMRKAAQRGRGR